MKTKKLLNSNQSRVVTNNENSKSVVDDLLSPLLLQTDLIDGDVDDSRPTVEPIIEANCRTDGILGADTESTVNEDQILSHMPPLKPIPDHISSEVSSHSRHPMPALKPIPLFIDWTNPSAQPMDTFAEPLQPSTSQMSSNCVTDTNVTFETDLMDPSMIFDIAKILTQKFPIISSAFDGNTSVVDNSFTQLIANTSQELTEADDKCCDQNQSLNTSTNIVNIDLNDNSNSPILHNNQTISPTKEPTPPTAQVLDFSNCGSNVSQTAETRISASVPKVSTGSVSHFPLTPFEYCAKDYRFFGITRQSGRHKKAGEEENDDEDYEMSMSSASWSEIDGTQYDIVVTKWSDEDLRKDIMKEIGSMRFKKSIHDKGVFMCFTAFNGWSSMADGLHCVMRLDRDAVKEQRFSALAVTRLYLICGECLVTAENNKQKKQIETGHEVYIPSNARYSIINRSVDSSYFYVIVKKN